MPALCAGIIHRRFPELATAEGRITATRCEGRMLRLPLPAAVGGRLALAVCGTEIAVFNIAVITEFVGCDQAVTTGGDTDLWIAYALEPKLHLATRVAAIIIVVVTVVTRFTIEPVDRKTPPGPQFKSAETLSITACTI